MEMRNQDGKNDAMRMPSLVLKQVRRAETFCFGLHSAHCVCVGGRIELSDSYFLFFQRLVMSSSVLPLVSGTRRSTKNAAATHIMP